jgi:hypothetical protein
MEPPLRLLCIWKNNRAVQELSAFCVPELLAALPSPAPAAPVESVDRPATAGEEEFVCLATDCAASHTVATAGRHTTTPGTHLAWAGAAQVEPRLAPVEEAAAVASGVQLAWLELISTEAASRAAQRCTLLSALVGRGTIWLSPRTCKFALNDTRACHRWPSAAVARRWPPRRSRHNAPSSIPGTAGCASRQPRRRLAPPEAPWRRLCGSSSWRRGWAWSRAATSPECGVSWRRLRAVRQPAARGVERTAGLHGSVCPVQGRCMPVEHGAHQRTECSVRMPWWRMARWIAFICLAEICCAYTTIFLTRFCPVGHCQGKLRACSQ